MSKDKPNRRLTKEVCDRECTPGKYADVRYPGLYLAVTKAGNGITRSWIYRYSWGVTSKGNPARKEMGLGPYTGELESAHKAWRDASEIRRSGRDPITVRAEEKAKAIAAEANKPTTFTKYAKGFLERHATVKLKNPKSRQLWDRMIVYTESFFGNVDITLVTRPMIWDALIPIWQKKPAEAKKFRGCIDNIFEEMCNAGLRNDNPTPRKMPAQDNKATTSVRKRPRSGYWLALKTSNWARQIAEATIPRRRCEQVTIFLGDGKFSTPRLIVGKRALGVGCRFHGVHFS